MAIPEATKAVALKRELSKAQEACLDANFDQKDAFYLSKDIHPMLDCANLQDVPAAYIG